VRRVRALESAGSFDTVIFDKTGTLTQDRLHWAGTFTREGADPAQALALAAAMARHSLHPASRALADVAAADVEFAQVEEVPGRGLRAIRLAKGGPCPAELRLGSAEFCNAPATPGGARMELHLADEHGWLATFELDEALRADALQATKALRALGLHLQLLSGDRSEAAVRVGQHAGIHAAYGGCSPQDKLEHVRAAQSQGHRIAMVGDGMNDGPVLARADVSVAMGQAVPLAQARSDFVVLGGQLDAVPTLLRLARRTRRIVRENLAWAAVYNMVCVPLAVAGMMPPWLAGLGMAASSFLVVANSARLARIN
jgi:P-type Cu2+ transporter